MNDIAMQNLDSEVCQGKVRIKNQKKELNTIWTNSGNFNNGILAGEYHMMISRIHTVGPRVYSIHPCVGPTF